MNPHVLAQVDALDGDADPGEKRFDQRVLVADERVDRPLVICIGVDVEQRGVSLERLTDGVDDAGVPGLRDVGHGLEHDPYPTKPFGWGDWNRLEPTFRLAMRVVGDASDRNRLQPTAKPNPSPNHGGSERRLVDDRHAGGKANAPAQSCCRLSLRTTVTLSDFSRVVKR